MKFVVEIYASLRKTGRAGHAHPGFVSRIDYPFLFVRFPLWVYGMNQAPNEAWGRSCAPKLDFYWLSTQVTAPNDGLKRLVNFYTYLSDTLSQMIFLAFYKRPPQPSGAMGALVGSCIVF